MKIKDYVTENCPTCNSFIREISPEEWGCDQCRKPIVPCGNDERLDVKLFYKKDGETCSDDYYFCSWACVFNFVLKKRTNYFITLPYVSFDHKIKGRRAKDFFDIIKKLAKP